MWPPWRTATEQASLVHGRAAARGMICHMEPGGCGRCRWCCGGMACRQCVPFHDGPLLGFCLALVSSALWVKRTALKVRARPPPSPKCDTIILNANGASVTRQRVCVCAAALCLAQGHISRPDAGWTPSSHLTHTDCLLQVMRQLLFQMGNVFLYNINLFDK